MKVAIPGPLDSHTGGVSQVEAGAALDEVLRTLDA